MTTRNFLQMVRLKGNENKFVCAGLDSDLAKIPEAAHISGNPYNYLGLDIESTIFGFNESIIDATSDLVCAYKPNIAFYEAYGAEGLFALRKSIECIQEVAPDVPVILDAKRADIGNTNKGYVGLAFDYLGADAITVHPYLGEEALKPFLEREDKGVIVLCRTSNPGAGEFQDREVVLSTPDMKRIEERLGYELLSPSVPLYLYVAFRVAEYWNTNNNCALVVGATYPEELVKVRRLVGDMLILIPGIGAQGGDLEKTVNAGRNSQNQGIIINSSSGIIFASSGHDFAEVARAKTLELDNQTNKYLRR